MIPSNAVFSPDSRSVLVKGSDDALYIANASNPTNIQKMVFWYMEEPIRGLFSTQDQIRGHILQTKWLTNGNIAMNSQNGAILWEVLTDGSTPNWQIEQ